MEFNCVIDTNVIVSALLSKYPDSATKLVLDGVFDDAITPIYSYDILKEYVDVLNRKEFKFDNNLINKVIDVFKDSGIITNPIDSGIDLVDKKDVPFYDAYNYTKEYDSYLVTGNLKHYPIEDNIVPPRRMIDIINERSDT